MSALLHTRAFASAFINWRLRSIGRGIKIPFARLRSRACLHASEKYAVELRHHRFKTRLHTENRLMMWPSLIGIWIPGPTVTIDGRAVCGPPFAG
jgi:hypothetical protein